MTYEQQRYVQLIEQGINNTQACRIVGINRKTGNRWRYGPLDSEFRRGARALSAGADRGTQAMASSVSRRGGAG